MVGGLELANGGVASSSLSLVANMVKRYQHLVVIPDVYRRRRSPAVLEMIVDVLGLTSRSCHSKSCKASND